MPPVTPPAPADADAGDDDADEARRARDRGRRAANGRGAASNGAAADVDDRHDEDGNQRRDQNEGNRAPDPPQPGQPEPERPAAARAARAVRAARATPSPATAGAGAAGRDRRNDDESFQGEPVDVEGLLDLRDEGYGFLRLHGYLPSKDDVYVSVKQVRQFGLRKGDHLKGKSRPAPPQREEPGAAADRRGQRRRPRARRSSGARFEDLTPLFPDERLHARAGRTTRAT